MNEIKTLIMKANHEAASNWLKATQLLYRGIDKYPHEESLYKELGDLYFKKGHYYTASELYLDAHRLNPWHYNVAFNLGYCFYKEKQYEKAVHYYTQIKHVNPEAAYNRCLALCELNKKNQAITGLEELTAEYFRSPRPFFLLSKLYIDFQRFQKALTVLDRAEELFGHTKELFHLRAVAYFHRKWWLQAYLSFAKVDELGSLGHEVFLRMYALTAERIGKSDKAITILKRCIEKFPRFFAAYYDLIRIYLIHNYNNDALKLIKTLKKKFGVGLKDMSHYQGTLFDAVVHGRHRRH